MNVTEFEMDGKPPKGDLSTILQSLLFRFPSEKMCDQLEAGLSLMTRQFSGEPLYTDLISNEDQTAARINVLRWLEGPSVMYPSISHFTMADKYRRDDHIAHLLHGKSMVNCEKYATCSCCESGLSISTCDRYGKYLIIVEHLLISNNEIIDKDSQRLLLNYDTVVKDIAETIREKYEHIKSTLQHLTETDKLYIGDIILLLPASNDKGITKLAESWTKYQRFLSSQITWPEEKPLKWNLVGQEMEQNYIFHAFSIIHEIFSDVLTCFNRGGRELYKPRKKYFSKRRSYNVGTRLPTENKCDKSTAGLSYRTRRFSREPFSDLSNQDEDNDNFIQDETIQQEAMSSQDLSNEDEDNDSFIRNGGCPLPPRRRKQFHPTGSITLLLLGKGWILLLFALLAGLPQFSCGTNTVGCPTEQYILLKGRAVVKCDVLGDFPSIYWYKNTNNDASAFIQKVNGEVAGTGYTTGEYNIDNEGSLVINNVTIQDDRTFRVKVLDSKLVASSYDVTLIVYAEPAEPIPVIPECSGQSACILKGYSGRVLTCIHGESIPAMEVSWFLRVGTQDRILNATVNQTMSGDSLTFTTSALLAIEKIPIDANMNQLLVVMCKSNLPLPGMKGSRRKILLDFSVDDSLTNETYLDPVYAFERQEDFMINCQSKIGTDNSVVLWMYKSLNSEKVEYILYSAYGEVTFSQHASADFNLTNSGTLVIKQVDIHHEGYFACVTSSENTTESFVQNLVVIVLPNPSIIVVKGCEPFQACHLSAQEAETVTCTVNGVRPRVDMSIVTYPMNVVVTKTIVSSYEEGGLFYTTIEGRVDVSKKTCGQNVTVICQARGPAAYGFMSDAFVTVPVDKKDCIELSTVTVLPDDDCHTNHLLILIIANFVSILLSALCLGFCMRRNIRKNVHPSLEPEPHLNGDMSGHPLLPLREELPYRQKDKQEGPGTIKHHYI